MKVRVDHHADLPLKRGQSRGKVVGAKEDEEKEIFDIKYEPTYELSLP